MTCKLGKTHAENNILFSLNSQTQDFSTYFFINVNAYASLYLDMDIPVILLITYCICTLPLLIFDVVLNNFPNS